MRSFTTDLQSLGYELPAVGLAVGVATCRPR
jgi:hypothetical protein